MTAMANNTKPSSDPAIIVTRPDLSLLLIAVSGADTPEGSAIAVMFVVAIQAVENPYIRYYEKPRATQY